MQGDRHVNRKAQMQKVFNERENKKKKQIFTKLEH